MLSISLTGNFLDPFISTGTHFISFYLEKHGLRSKPEAKAKPETKKGRVIKA
jgi:hypothetical protein